MSFIEKKYHVNGWRGHEYCLTAKELYKRVMKDKKSDYNWIASATELVRICDVPGFPREYAQDIKIAILNCFANLVIKERYPYVYKEDTDEDAVYYCYNSLSGTENS